MKGKNREEHVRKRELYMQRLGMSKGKCVADL